MRKLVFIFLCVMGPLTLLNGQADIDSLIHELDNSLEDTTRLRLLEEVSDYFRTRNYDTAIYYLDQYVLLAEERNDLQSLAKAYYFMGGSLSHVGSINTAVNYFNRSLDFYRLDNFCNYFLCSSFLPFIAW